MHDLLTKIKAYIRNKAKPIRDTLIFIGFTFALVFAFVLIINISIIANTEDKIYTADEISEKDKKYDCILVLGAGVRADGTPSPMLEDRLITALEVLNGGASELLFISGDSESEYYRETRVMKNYLLDSGVSQSSLLEDGFGLSTYESIWRAKYVYGFDRVIIISQGYHLCRALHIANALGMDACGVDSALRPYRKQPLYDAREGLARVKDMILSELVPSAEYTERWEENYE